MELAYVAHSERCALLLDGEGVCRWFVMKVEDAGVAASAKRCIGAQFVASLDPALAGLLGHEPMTGKNILLARVDDGRVSLVRFGPLQAFDTIEPPAEIEPELYEVPRLELVQALVPAPVESEPLTTPGQSIDLDLFTNDDDDEEDEDATRVGEQLPYRPSGFEFRAHAASDVENIETTRFARNETLLRESRRGILPRRR